MRAAWTRLRDTALTARAGAAELANVTTLRLAVTGLSRAGKTVFLVSLIGNLLAMARPGGGRDSLPKLAAALADAQGRSRLAGVEIESSGTQRIPRFAYEALRDGLSRDDAPAWPEVTDKPALITLRLLIRPRPGLGQAKSLLLGPRVVRLELLDYPGEWLVDLPLLEQSWEAWSAETLARMRTPPRAAMAADFLAFLASLDPAAPADEAVALHGFRLYRDALRRFRDEAGLRWLQPGRFLMPGPWGEAPFQHFFPWSVPSPRPGSLGAQLRDRFGAYKAEVRSSFFEPYFNEFNRQVVLVDVLGALFAGRAAFEDTRHAVGAIGASYARLLEGGWPLGRRIEHVAFVATKSDHVDDLQRANLALILREMVGSAPRRARQSVHAAAALRCTVDADGPMVDGRASRVVMGVPLGETRQRAFSPGTVPAGPVPPGFWNSPYFVMPQLRPPLLGTGDGMPLDHLNLDEVLADLLGEAL